MNDERPRRTSEVLKRGYLEEELCHIYELGHVLFENGDLRGAETIMTGLNEAAPDFAPGWLGTCYIELQNHRIEPAARAASHALKLAPTSVEAMLFTVTCLLSLGDYNRAGTYLGEVGDRIQEGKVTDPNAVRFFKAQLARYQNR